MRLFYIKTDEYITITDITLKFPVYEVYKSYKKELHSLFEIYSKKGFLTGFIEISCWRLYFMYDDHTYTLFKEIPKQFN